jgi:hypothetical protein
MGRLGTSEVILENTFEHVGPGSWTFSISQLVGADTEQVVEAEASWRPFFDQVRTFEH